MLYIVYQDPDGARHAVDVSTAATHTLCGLAVDAMTRVPMLTKVVRASMAASLPRACQQCRQSLEATR